MPDVVPSSAEVGRLFSEQWWGRGQTLQVYDDLLAKLRDRSYVVRCEPPQVNRAVIACEYVIKNVPQGGRVLDMACGLGFNACCLAAHGYRAEGFDVSEVAIERAKELARRLGQGPEMFTVQNESYLFDLPDGSFDAVLAMGFFRYLTPEAQTTCYRHVHRILKPRGKFLLAHQNLLFEAFALNDGTLRFWADVIESYSDAAELLGGKTVFDALSEMVKVPPRVYASHSISRNMRVQVENPLTYGDVTARHGFRLEAIRFPASHLLPPALEARVDQEKLLDLKRKVDLDRSDDWRAVFIEFEFLAFLEKA